MTKVLIVGGVAGGATAATRLRRLDEFAEIILFERGPHVSLANCGMPYYIGGVIEDRNSLLMVPPEVFRDELRIDVRLRHEVVAIDRQAKQVSVRNLLTGRTYQESYDKLILSPGAKPLVPPVPGTDLPGVFTLRGLLDMDAIKAWVDSGQARTAVVVGGGFIGLEMAENLVRRGLQVAVVEMLNQVMTPLDVEMAALVHAHLRLKGVGLALSDGLKGIAQAEDGRLAVTLQSGKVAPADMVVLAVGVQPESDLAKAAGLEVGPRGHIVANEAQQTSDPDIYAVGDAVQVKDAVTGRPTAIPLAGPANRQGRLAADHIVGRQVAYQGSLGTSIVKVFDLTVATAGLNAKQLKGQGIPFRSTTTHSMDRAGYYPGGTQMAIKLLWAPDSGRALGAQIVGANGVDRTIDVLAAAIKGGMTAFDLEHLELAYSPQYGSAKDPVNISGFVAANTLRGDIEMLTWEEMAALDPQQDGLLDVCSKEEWDLAHLPGAVHIPLPELRKRMGELSQDKRWVVYCRQGKRGYVAARLLSQHGYRVADLTGGLETYRTVMEKQTGFDEWLQKVSSADVGRARRRRP